MNFRNLFSFSVGLVALFLFSTHANAFDPVVVTFQSEITQTSASQGEVRENLNDYLPSPINVGDTLTGYQVYDLNIDTDSSANIAYGIYPESTVCAGISVNGITIDINQTAEGGYLH